MSGDDVPYQLRPNKFIDRQIFIDLLCRLVPNKGADKYVYVSMGGKHLVDHGAVYRFVGITKLFSFDSDTVIVGRQNINKPISDAECWRLDSGQLCSSIDKIFEKFQEAENLIVWLDYTDPHQRLTQLQELVEISKKFQDGDIIRITINSNLGTLDGDRGASSWQSEGFKNPGAYRIAKLRDQLGHFVPVDIVSVEDNNFPSVLCRCIGIAISQVASERRDIYFKPLLNTTYRDGQRMVTVTCIVNSKSDTNDSNPNLKAWKFTPAGWGDVTQISSPDLSFREKLKLDQHIADDPTEIATQIGFKFDQDDAKTVAIIKN